MVIGQYSMGYVTAIFITLTTTSDIKTEILRQKIFVLDHFKKKIDLPNNLHGRIENFFNQSSF
jgi:hypothetical protein